MTTLTGRAAISARVNEIAPPPGSVADRTVGLLAAASDDLAVALGGVR